MNKHGKGQIVFDSPKTATGDDEYPNSRYIGSFSNDKKHGQGVFYDMKNEVKLVE